MSKRSKSTTQTTLHAARTRKEIALARKHELECAELEERLVDVEEFGRRWDGIFIRLKALVMGSKLTEQEKFEFLTELEKVLRES